MPRTVKKILDEDAKKPAVGAVDPVDDENDEVLIEEGEEDDDQPASTGKKKPTAEEEAVALRKQLDAERARADREAARAEEADKRAGTASAKADSALQQQIVTRKSEIDTKITNAKTNLDSIKQQLKTARSAGDTDAEVDLQDAMTNARYELNAAEWDKKNFTAWEDNQKKVSEQQPDSSGQSPYTAKERNWIKQHPEFNTSKKFARMAKIAAQEARDEGLAQDSKAYFDYIEEALTDQGLMTKDDDPNSGADEDARADASLAAAPQKTGSQSPPPGKNSKYPHIPSGFRIPADWVQASEDQGFDDPREYANIRLEEDAKAKANQ